MTTTTVSADTLRAALAHFDDDPTCLGVRVRVWTPFGDVTVAEIVRSSAVAGRYDVHDPETPSLPLRAVDLNTVESYVATLVAPS